MARKKGMNNKNRKLKKKYIYFFMEGSKNCSEDKYIKEYYGQFQDKATDIGFRFISCGDGSWKNIEKEINKEKRNIIDENIEIWCVLDKDKNDLDKINIKIGECSQKNYENILTRKLNKKYKKSEGIKFTFDDKERAIRQSKKIHEKYQRLEEKINNSFNCTNFYMILEKFKEVFYNFDLE